MLSHLTDCRGPNGGPFDLPFPPTATLNAGAATTEVERVIEALDPEHRLGEAAAPLFLSVAPASGSPGLLYVGLTQASESWLRFVAGPTFADGRRQELLRSLRRLQLDYELADHPVQQTLDCVRLLWRTDPAQPLILKMMPLGLDRAGGCGWAYSRSPHTGAAGLTGTFRPQVTGLQTLILGGEDLATSSEDDPWRSVLASVVCKAEKLVGDPVLVRFVVERGSLWVLSLEPASLRGAALVTWLIESAQNRRITTDEALRAVTDEVIADALPGETCAGPVVAHGIGVAEGAAAGIAVFSSADAVSCRAAGQRPILVLRESRPQDLPGLLAAVAVVTQRGGHTSHAAVVARSLGLPCTTALQDAEVIAAAGRLRLADGSLIQPHEPIAVDGRAGTVHRGGLATEPRGGNAEQVRAGLEWLTERTESVPALEVRANADRACEAVRGRDLGAKGIGLCRTEHMLLGEHRKLIEQVLLAPPGPAAASALDRLQTVMRQEFIALLEAMDGLPVAIRLLDPPRHEFLPDLTELAVEEATMRGAGRDDSSTERQLALVRRMSEHNPMLGVRGVRLGLLRKDLTVAQFRAVIESTLILRRAGRHPRPQLLIPMVSTVGEVDAIRDLLDEIIQCLYPAAADLTIPLGAMVETPRTAMLVDTIADRVDFLSIGTNDLTAFLWGLSRDDADTELIPSYVRAGILDASPFEELDLSGVGQLIRQIVSHARAAKPGIRIGVCGEHAATLPAIEFLARLGVDYVSCVPTRVPASRLAAARAGIGQACGRSAASALPSVSGPAGSSHGH